MRGISFVCAKCHQGFLLGAYARWRDAQTNGVELGLKLGMWSVGVKLTPEQTLADRLVEALEK
jgi:hypothetical protein